MLVACGVLSVRGANDRPEASSSSFPLSDYVVGPSDYWARGYNGLMQQVGQYNDAISISPQTIVDVMVLYTTAAKSECGQTEVERRIALGIAYINEACNRSGVHARFRLVYAGEAVGHEETSYASDELRWLSNDEQVATIRDAVGADLVSLIVRDGLPTGGLAYLPGAYSVSNGNAFTFAHEIGHNLGCAHDRAHADLGTAREGINFGYSFTPAGCSVVYGDIMSYVGSQIEQFSNPDEYFQGAPTGLPEGHLDSAGNPDGSDNALVLNRTIPYAAGGRVALSSMLMNPLLAADGAEFSFMISTSETGRCAVESSPDLIQWRELTSVMLEGEGVAILDGVRDAGQRFYRARTADGLMGSQLGFIVKTVPPGFSMISNPLESGHNAIDTLLPGAPEGTQVYKWVEGLSRWTVTVYSLGSWGDPAMSLHPGEGVIVRNPSAAPFTIHFVGEVNLALHSRVPLGQSIRRSAVPQRGLITAELGYLPFGTGGQVMRMTPAGGYEVYTFDEDGWSPHEPVIEVGEAFWSRNPLNAFAWDRVLPSATAR
jgi:hypothetical protein